jgi:hypothetical protein
MLIDWVEGGWTYGMLRQVWVSAERVETYQDGPEYLVVEV